MAPLSDETERKHRERERNAETEETESLGQAADAS